MDTSTTPTGSETSDSSLTTAEAGAAFASMLDPVEPPEKEEPAEVEAEPQPNEQEEGADPDPTPEPGADEIVTVLVDGKPVELTKAQIAEAHKSGLRQADYTRKTQETAEEKRVAQAETAKAREDRQKYAEGLNKAAAVLEAQLQEQQNIDWQHLLDSDPVEYLRQQHIAQKRHADLQQTLNQKAQLDEVVKAEQASSYRDHIQSQRELLLAKVPEWKDEAKLKQGTKEIKDYLLKAGYSESEISNVHDHRAVLNVRKAMLYDEMVAKASVAAKKISSTPARVERPSSGQPQNIDKRTAAFQRLGKSGRVEDAGAVFASFI